MMGLNKLFFIVPKGKSPVNLTDIYLDCGREKLEAIHADMREDMQKPSCVINI